MKIISAKLTQKLSQKNFNSEEIHNSNYSISINRKTETQLQQTAALRLFSSILAFTEKKPFLVSYVLLHKQSFRLRVCSDDINKSNLILLFCTRVVLLLSCVE